VREHALTVCKVPIFDIIIISGRFEPLEWN